MKQQTLLPLVPDGATPVNDLVSVVNHDDKWTWFYGARPIFAHPQGDRDSFRMFSAQLVCQGACKQVEIVKAFGVSPISVKRSVKQYRQEGVPSFYRTRPTRGGTVMTPHVIGQAQDLLNQGNSRGETARQLGVQYDTLRKAINQGRLTEPPREKNDLYHRASDKSQRGQQDVAAADGLGVACTRLVERVGAAFGLLRGGASTQFQPCRDVSCGGVLCAMPALAENGLFRHLDRYFTSLSGYYTTVQIVSLLASMALCRIKTVEQLQYHPPGELGKLLGLDRVPEVRCLRNKLAALSENQAPEKWAAQLSRDWLEADPDLAGALYVDGHVRLYHGQQTKLPRRYVARQRLCLRGTTDYWVNDALGQPFFVIERPLDQGMLEAIQNDIVPRLLADVPGQPTKQQLHDDPHLHRFVMLFDREGYSPKFFREMWQTHRIACITYHKYPQDAWAESEFRDTQLTLPNGAQVSLLLAERGSWIGSRQEGLWVREIRKLTESGHQTSLISSAYGHEALQDAGALFSRWSQENFFRYAMQHFGIDLLSEYGTDGFPEPKRPVVNPARRELDTRRRSLQSRLTRQQAQYAALTLHPEADQAKLQQWQQRKATLVESIEQLEHELSEVKQQQSQTPKHIPWSELPEESKFEQLAPSRKRLLDTVKMLAYRAETSLVGIVREALSREDDARVLLQDLFRQEADLHPDESRGQLEVRIHPFSNPRSNRAIEHLLEQLNASEMKYPGTSLTLTYSLIGASQN
jgi:predicted  nucleic acid-binding Zn-ribbon protein